MRRTARLDALLSARVKDKIGRDVDGSILDLSPDAVPGRAVLVVEMPYALDKETSAGAMQKSISLTFPREVVGDTAALPTEAVATGLEETTEISALSAAWLVRDTCCGELPGSTADNTSSMGGCSMSAPGTARKAAARFCRCRLLRCDSR